MTSKDKSQRDRFIEAARNVGADEDPEAFKERLKKLVAEPKQVQKPAVRKAPRK